MPYKPLFWERFCGEGLRRKGNVELTDTRDRLSNLVEGLTRKPELTMPPDRSAGTAAADARRSLGDRPVRYKTTSLCCVWEGL